MNLTAIADLMDALAVDTWHSIRDARQLDLDWGEVTATHANLLALKRQTTALGSPMTIARVLGPAERTSGADLEIWLRTPSGSTLGFSIQAKRVFLRNGKLEYSALGHHGFIPGERQYDTLLRHAAAVGTFPFHLFYNGWDLPNASVSFPQPGPEEFYGCALVPTATVRHVRSQSHGKGLNRADHYMRVAVPWSALVRIPTSGTNGGTPPNTGPGGGSPGSGSPSSTGGTQGKASSQQDLATTALEAIVEKFSEGAGAASASTASLRDGLPDYAKKAVAGEQTPSNDGAASDLPALIAVIDLG